MPRGRAYPQCWCGAETVTLQKISAERRKANPEKRKARAENNLKWQGRRQAYNAYMNSSAWAVVRKKTLERDGNRCVDCASTTVLHVHHLHYKTFGHEIGDELVTVCYWCHERRHGRKFKKQPKTKKAKAIRRKAG
jgi:5-methylcytosine-specific restriction endonuclease McrA